jgi:diguanylate cyclase (GGDEF)-like protein
MTAAQRRVHDDAIGWIDALVSLARSSREDTVDDVLRAVVETVHSTAGFDIVVFNRYQRAWDDYEVVLVIGPSNVQALMHTRRSREQFEQQLLTSDYEIQPGTYFVPGSAEVWEEVDDFVVSSQTRPVVAGGWDPEDALLVQLRDSKGEPLGVLSIDEPRSGRTPDVSELRLLRAICSHAEQSLENAHVAAQAERQRDRMTELLRASTRFSECQTYRDVLDTACEALVPRLGFERVAIYYGQGTPSLSLATATFDGVAITSTLEAPVFELFGDRTREYGGCWLVPAAEVHGSDSGRVRSLRNGTGKFCWSDDLLLAPVFDAEGTPRLVFAIEDPIDRLRPSKIDCELIRLLVEQADAAFERVTFRRRLEDLADRDASTGLLNRRALDRVTRETSASLMICDLDSFKSVNDTYGHEVGDAVIRQFADLMKSLSREQDLAIRLGGDEFMMFLPATSESHARSIAERLRRGISSQVSPLVASGVTVSIGLTQIEAGEHLSDAMRRADQALYSAKEGGRNQIVAN